MIWVAWATSLQEHNTVVPVPIDKQSDGVFGDAVVYETNNCFCLVDAETLRKRQSINSFLLN